MKYICCLILFFTVLLPSCQWGRQEAFFPDEGLAERLLRENPDSLAMILEEQVVPAELSDSLRAEYGWWITRLHQRQGRNMVNDSLIHYTLRCYEQQQSPRLTEAYMLAAMQVNYSGDKREEAKEESDTQWEKDPTLPLVFEETIKIPLCWWSLLRLWVIMICFRGIFLWYLKTLSTLYSIIML